MYETIIFKVLQIRLQMIVTHDRQKANKISPKNTQGFWLQNSQAALREGNLRKKKLASSIER